MTRGLFALVLGVAAVSAAGLHSPAAAQAPSVEKKKLAKQYVEAGLAAQGAGDYDQAVALYRKAYEQVPHPLMFFNIGQAYRLAGRDEEALAAYQKYLADDPKGAKAKEAKGFISEIEPRVTKARADAAEKTRITADAEAKRKAAEAAAAEVERKRREVEDLAAQREAEARKKRDGSGGGGGRKRLGLIVGGTGVAVIGAGAVFGVLAMRSWNEAKELCDDDRVCADESNAALANDLAETTRQRGNLATVFLGVGGAALAAGIVIYLTAPSGGGRAEHAIRVVPSHDGALATWSGRW
ncbi:MAG: tetratricopeptide repeat protein [Deltaproteobacteria bacterium]|nr:tetratricopeptide repeat protein [Deltaproteobacteria bacterium]